MAIPNDVQSFLNSITNPKTRDEAEKTFNSIERSTGKAQKAFEAIKTAFGDATSSASMFNESLTDSLDLAQGIVDALKKQEGAIKRATKAMSSIVSLGQQLLYEDQKLDALSERQLEKMTKEAKLRQKEIAANVYTIAQTLNKEAILDKIAQKESEFNTLQEKGLHNLSKQEKKTREILQDELEILKAYTDSQDPYNKLVDAVKQRYKLEQAVTKTFGLTGVALSAASSIASKMGMGHISDQLDDINGKLRYEMREAIKLNDDKALGFGQRFMFAAKGAMLTGKAIGKGMLDPLYLMGKIYSAFLDVNKESVELSRLSGQNGDAMAGANFALATSVDFLKTAGELTKQMGLNAQNVFSANVMAGASELKNTMGLSAEEAGGLAVMAQTSGRDIKDMSTDMVSVTSSFNKSNRSAVSQGVALKAAAAASDSLKISLGNNPIALQKAAAAATRLGLTLQDIDNISASLVDFQSSIANELEAELLTGKDLNLEKARELALNNDIAGVANEIFKNSSDINEFGKMNRIQQEAYAKSLGLTKDQMAKIAYNKALDNNMTEEQAALAAGVEASDMRRMAIQEKMALVMDKIFQAFAPILDIAEAILDPIAKMLAVVGGVVGYITQFLAKMHLLTPLIVIMVAAFAGKAVASFFGTAVKGAKDLLGSMKELLSGDLFQKLKAFGGGIKDAFGSAKGGGIADTLKEKAVEKVQEVAGGGIADTLKDKAKEKVEGTIEDKVGGLADKVMGAEEEVPEDSGSKLKGILNAVEKIKAKDLVIGAAALVVAAGAMFLLGKAMQEFEKVGEDTYYGAGAALLGLTVALVALGAAGVGVIIGAGALLIAAAAVFVLGKALQEVGKGMDIMVPALTVLDSLGSKAAGLMTVKASLMGIADGLREIADAGTGAIPVLDKLNTLGGGSRSVGEAKGRADEGTLAIVAAKLDTLISVAKQGTTVTLDGKVVARSALKNIPQVTTKTP